MGTSQHHRYCRAPLPRRSSLQGPWHHSHRRSSAGGSPSDLTVGRAPAPGQREAYRVGWCQEGSQSSPGGLVALGPDTSGLTLRGPVPGSCYTMWVWAWAEGQRLPP